MPFRIRKLYFKSMAKVRQQQRLESGQEEGMGSSGPVQRIWQQHPSFFKLKINKYNTFSLEVLLLVLLKLAPLLHTFAAYLSLVPNTFRALVGHILKELAENSGISVCLQVGVYLAKIGLCLAVWSQGEQGEQSILRGMGKRVMRNFNIILQVDVVISSFLLMGAFSQNAAGFLFSMGLSFFSSLFLLNYVDRRDVLYFSSLRGSLFLTGFNTTSYIINSAFVLQGNFFLFNFCDLALSFVLFWWYMKYGYLLLPHRGFRVFLEGVVIGKISLGLYFTDYYFLQQEITLGGMGIKIGLLCGIILLTCRFCQSHLHLFQSLLTETSPEGVKRFDIFLCTLIDATNTDQERDHFIISMLSRRIDKSHLHAPYHTLSFRSQTELTTLELTRQAEVRIEIDRLYCHSLDQHASNEGLILDYCEFILNEFHNIYKVCKLISRLHLGGLGYIQQLRLAKLRHTLRESNAQFNAGLFEGRMEIENMIKAEDTFNQITINIQAAISLQLKIWNAIGEQSINLTEVRLMIQEKLDLLKDTTGKWGTISRHLREQKRWHYIFMNYSFFLLNERLLYRDAEEFRNFTQDNFFIGTSNYLIECDPPQRLYSAGLLFDKKAFYIRAKIQERTLIISNVSRAFQNFVEYSQQEILGSPVHILMPEQFKWTHDDKLMLWLERGSCVDEVQYGVKFTSFLTKYGEEVPAVKYFKLFVDVGEKGMLQFVCLLKANQVELPQNLEERSETDMHGSVSSRGIARDFSPTKRGNLRLENNIFMKQDNLKTNSHIREIQQAKKAIRLLTLSLITLIILLLLVTRKDTATLTDNIVQFLNFLNLYRFPMALGKNYMKNFLNVGSQSSVISQIIAQTQNVQAFNSEPLTIKTLFDPTLNVPKMYPPFLNDSFNQGIVYDQTEIYGIIISSITSLSRLPINRTGYDFAMLNMYLVPSYDHMINSTKIRFHETFQENLGRMLDDQLIVAGVEAGIFLLIVIFVGHRIRRYFLKGRKVMQIVFDFSDLDVKRVQCYWKNLLKHFQKLHIRNKIYCLDTTISLRATQNLEIDLDIEIFRLKLQGEQNVSCNKREKRVFQTKKARGKAIRTVLVVALALLVLIISVLGIQISNVLQIYRLQTFQTDGFYLLRYYPATSVLGHALMERYYYQIKPNQVRYRPERYQEYISSMLLMGQSEYIGTSISSSSYYEKLKNYMFGNPCTFAPQVLAAANSNMTACMNGFNRTLSLGITTFLRAVHPTVENYINLRTNLTVPQLNDVTTTLTIVAYYVTDAINTWAAEFTQQVVAYERLDTMLCLIAAGVILLLHVVFCEKFLFYFLESDYKFIREVFDKMVPNFIISVEKVIRQKFIMEGIINQG